MVSRPDIVAPRFAEVKMPPKKGTKKKATKSAAKPLDVENLSSRQLATLLGVERSTPMYWKKKGCPTNESGSFSLRAVYHWRISQLSDDVAKAKQEADNELARQRAIKTQILELELAEKRGGMISVVVANRHYANCIGAGRTALQGLPDRIVKLVTKDRQEVVRHDMVLGIEQALRTMARAGEEINDERRRYLSGLDSG